MIIWGLHKKNLMTECQTLAYKAEKEMVEYSYGKFWDGSLGGKLALAQDMWNNNNLL
jgi:hypothetical protein